MSLPVLDPVPSFPAVVSTNLLYIAVDGTDDPDWECHTGFVPTIAEDKAPPASDDIYAIVCGPPAMIRFAQPVLDNRG